jgi:hypothetical protein
MYTFAKGDKKNFRNHWNWKLKLIFVFFCEGLIRFHDDNLLLNSHIFTFYQCQISRGELKMKSEIHSKFPWEILVSENNRILHFFFYLIFLNWTEKFICFDLYYMLRNHRNTWYFQLQMSFIHLQQFHIISTNNYLSKYIFFLL